MLSAIYRFQAGIGMFCHTIFSHLSFEDVERQIRLGTRCTPSAEHERCLAPANMCGFSIFRRFNPPFVVEFGLEMLLVEQTPDIGLDRQ